MTHNRFGEAGWERPERTPRPRPVPVLLVLALAVVVLGAVVLGFSLTTGADGVGETSAGEDIDLPLDDMPPSTSPAPASAPARPDLPVIVEPTGTFLYLTDRARQITVVDVDARIARVRDLVELAPGDPPRSVAVVAGRLVFYGAGATYVLDPDGSVRTLGDSSYFLVSRTPGRVWLVTTDVETGRSTVREVAIDGSVTVPASTAPEGWVVEAAGDGVVVDTERGMVVHRAGNTLRRLDRAVFLMGSSTRTVAWCDDPCEDIHVSDVTTSRDAVVKAPAIVARFHEGTGVMSPDGRYLAAAARLSPELTRVDAGLAIVDLESGAVNVVAEGKVARTPRLAWSADSEWVFFATTTRRGDLGVGAVRPDGVTAFAIPETEQRVQALAAGSDLVLPALHDVGATSSRR